MKTKNKSFKRLFAFLVALVMVTALVPSVIFAAEPTFPDVPATHWAYDYIEALAKDKIIGGYPDGTFGPENNVTRQQAAKMIAGAAGLEASYAFKSKFTDLNKAADDLKPFILALEEYKVVGGFADGSFGPTLNIKRSQAAKMIVNAFGLVKGELDVKFDDPVADAADQEYIDILASNGIVKGYTEDGKQLYKPYNLVTRAQLAKMIVEAMDWELEVFSVAGITNRIVAEANQQLEFALNGGSFAADADALADAGYTVTFKYNKTEINATEGLIDASASSFPDKFEYQVVITRYEEKYESEWKKVEVVDETAVDKIIEVEVQNDDEAVDFVTVGEDGNVFAVTKLVTVGGEEIDEDNDLNNDLDMFVSSPYPLKQAKSSNTAVAYWDGSNIVAVSPGTVTFDLIYGTGLAATDTKYTYKITVVVKAEQKLSSATLEDATTKYDKADDQLVALVLKDQNGDLMKDTVNVSHVIVKLNGTSVGGFSYPASASEGQVNLDLSDVKVGNQTLVLEYQPDSTKAPALLGRLTIQVVEVKNESPMTYELKITSTNKALDLSKNDNSDDVEITVVAKKDGVVQPLVTLEAMPAASVATSTDYYFAVDGAKVSVTAGAGTLTIKKGSGLKVGETEIRVVRKAGDKVDVLASLKVEVKNTAPKVVSVAKTSAKTEISVATAGTITAEEIANAVTANKLKVTMDPTTAAFDKDMIKAGSIVYIASNEELQFEIVDLNGGLEVSLGSVTLKP